MCTCVRVCAWLCVSTVSALYVPGVHTEAGGQEVKADSGGGAGKQAICGHEKNLK